MQKSKAEHIRNFVEVFPWITPDITAKHLYTDHWKEDYNKGYTIAYNQLLQNFKQGDLIRSIGDRVIYRQPGRDKRVGELYFEHNQAVISILANLHLRDYEAKYGGLKGSKTNSDGIINGIALEVDRGNHTARKALENQVLKYNGDEFDKILFVSATKTLLDDSSNRQLQFEAMKILMEKIKEFDLPSKLKKKLYFSTYIEASDPTRDPLKEKVWKNLKGKNISVV